MKDGIVTRERRKHCRRSVIWSAQLAVGEYTFDCGLLNISLSGARLRLDLPLKRGAHGLLTIAGVWRVPAKVAWCSDSQVGLRFRLPPDEVRLRLGEGAVERLGLDQAARAG